MKNDELKKDIEIIKRNYNSLKMNYNVKSIGIFGSIVRGQQKKHSDLDVVVEFSMPLGFFKFIELEDFLTHILGRQVDLATKKALKPAIRQAVLRETIYA